MNLLETVELINALKAAGVSRFKSHEHDIVLELRGGAEPSLAHTQTPVGSTPTPATISESVENTALAVDLINTLKMSPDELVNHIFPDGAL